MRTIDLVRAKLLRVAETDNPKNYQLIGADHCKFLVRLIDTLEYHRETVLNSETKIKELKDQIAKLKKGDL